MSVRRAAATVVVGCMSLLLLLGTAWVPRADPAVDALGSFSVTGDAVGVRFVYSPQNPLGLPSIVDVSVPEGAAALSAGPVGHSLASLIYPGPIVSDPQALVDLEGLNAPFKIPGWPVRAQADTAGPTETRDTSTVPGGIMDAVAKGDLVSAVASYPTLSQSVVSFASAETTTTVKRDTRSVVSDSKATLHDVKLLADVIHIHGVVSTAHVVSDGVAAHTTGDTRATGITVAGQAATIDGSGVHLSGAPGAAPVRQAQGFLDAFAAGGITIRLLQPTEQIGGPTGQRSSPGIQIETSVKLGGTGVGAVLNQVPSQELNIPNSPFQLADAITFIEGTQLTRVLVGAAQARADARPAVSIGADVGGLGRGAGGESPAAPAPSDLSGGGTGSPIGSGVAPNAAAPQLAGLAPEAARRTSTLADTTFTTALICLFLSIPLLAMGGRRFARVVLGGGEAPVCDLPSHGP